MEIRNLIATVEENRVTLTLIERLMTDRDEDAESESNQLLRLLVTAVHAFETKTYA